MKIMLDTFTKYQWVSRDVLKHLLIMKTNKLQDVNTQHRVVVARSQVTGAGCESSCHSLSVWPLSKLCTSKGSFHRREQKQDLEPVWTWEAIKEQKPVQSSLVSGSNSKTLTPADDETTDAQIPYEKYDSVCISHVRPPGYILPTTSNTMWLLYK